MSIGISRQSASGIGGGRDGHALRLKRDRAFYPTVLIIVAFYYALFAVMGCSIHALLVESVAIVIFLLRH